ncbi:MAG TPA: ABC transporter permease [Xanthomonadaceae bacterium]|jgi:putative ABC transport system permease protein|nr:ABC transporter permease [Xanthomonadaceae bacterium]
MSELLHQTAVLMKVGLASIRKRSLRAALTVAGAAGVVTVLVALLSIAEGYRRVVQTTAAADSVIVLMNGATAEVASSIGGDDVALVRQMREVARGPAGRPLLSAEVYTTAKLPSRLPGAVLNMAVRGVEEAAYGLTGVVVTEGRRPGSGRREVLVGRLAAGRLAGAGIGEDIDIGGMPWRVVGRFSAAGGLAESELWVDAGALASALDRGGMVQVLHLRLADGVGLRDFNRQLEDDPRLELRAFDLGDYLAEQSRALRTFLHVLCYGVSALMALGAAFAALGTSYASTSARIREIGAMKALGFSDHAIFSATLGESTLLTCVGGAIGALAAYLAFDGLQTSTVLHSTNYNQVAFSFAVSPWILAQAALLAVAIGVAGSLYPAWNVLRLTISQALSERR